MDFPGSGLLSEEWESDSLDSPAQPPTPPPPPNPAMPTSKSARKRAKKAAAKLASLAEQQQPQPPPSSSLSPKLEDQATPVPHAPVFVNIPAEAKLASLVEQQQQQQQQPQPPPSSTSPKLEDQAAPVPHAPVLANIPAVAQLASLVEQQQQRPPPSSPSPKLEDQAAPVPHAPVLANIPAPVPQFRNIIIHLISRPGPLPENPTAVILHKYRFRAPATSCLLELCDQIQQYFPADCAHLPITIEALQDESGNKLPLLTATVEYLNPGEVLYAVCSPPLIGPADGLPPGRGQLSNTQPDQEMADNQDQEMADNQETAENGSMARPSLREAAAKIKNAPPPPRTPAEQIVSTVKSTKRILWPSSPDQVPTPLSDSQPTRSAKRASVRRKQSDDLEIVELPPQPDFKFQPGVLRKKGSATAQTGPCVIIDPERNTPLAPAESLPSVSARGTRSKKTLAEPLAPPRSTGGKKRDLETNGKQEPQVVTDDEPQGEMDPLRIKQEGFDDVHMADRDDEHAQRASPAPQTEQQNRQEMRDRAVAAALSRKRSTAITPSKAAKMAKSSRGRGSLIRFPHEVTDLTRCVSPSPEESGDEMEPEGPTPGMCTGKATSAVKKAAIDEPTPPSTRASRFRTEAAKDEVDSEPDREAKIVGTPSTRMTRSAAKALDMPVQSDKSASRTGAQARPPTPSRNSAARAAKVQASHNATAPRVVAGKDAAAGRGHGRAGPMDPNKTDDEITEAQAPEKTTTPTRAAGKGAAARRGSVRGLAGTDKMDDEDTGGKMSGDDHPDRPVGHPKPTKLNRWADNRGRHHHGDQDDRAGASIQMDSPADGLAQPSRTTKRKAEEDSNLPPRSETKRAKKESREQAQAAAERREYVKSLKRAWENDVSSGSNGSVNKINRSLQSRGVTNADGWVNYFCGRMVDQPAEASPARAFNLIWNSILCDAEREAEKQGQPAMTTTTTAPGGDGGASDSEVSTVRLGREVDAAEEKGNGERQDGLSDVSIPEEA